MISLSGKKFLSSCKGVAALGTPCRHVHTSAHTASSRGTWRGGSSEAEAPRGGRRCRVLWRSRSVRPLAPQCPRAWRMLAGPS